MSSSDGGLRTSPDDFRLGDVLQFIIEELETPYGDMQLAVERPVEKDKVAGVWAMVKEAMRTNQPVMGRVLNAVNGGYSVGVAGIVAFCPFSQMSFLTASKVGMLQPFQVTSMNEAKRNIVLQDASVLRRRRGPREDLIRDQGAAPPSWKRSLGVSQFCPNAAGAHDHAWIYATNISQLVTGRAINRDGD